MFNHAALAAAQSNSSLKAPDMAVPACMTRRHLRSIPAFCRVIATPSEAAVVASWHHWNLGGDFGASGFLPCRIPSSTRGHASGLSCALRQARSSALAAPPYGLRFPSATGPP
jgi:hypothetical protein